MIDHENEISEEKRQFIKSIRAKADHMKELRKSFKYNPTDQKFEEYEACRSELKQLLAKLR